MSLSEADNCEIYVSSWHILDVILMNVKSILNVSYQIIVCHQKTGPANHTVNVFIDTFLLHVFEKRPYLLANPGFKGYRPNLLI